MDAETPALATLLSAARGRPRSPPPETPQARILRLQAELEAAQTALRLEADKQATIIGRAVLDHASKHPDFRRDLAPILRVNIKAKADQSAVAQWLVGEASS